MTGFLLPVITLWRREIVRFIRQRSRLGSALSTPLVFWLLLGGGFSASFRPPGVPQGTGYLEYLYPGMIILVILFTAIFATISVIEDRKVGFLQGVLVAPISRASIVLGQALGGATLALFQGVLFLLLAPLAGVHLTVTAVMAGIVVMLLVSFALTSLGLIIAWRMQSIQGFHAIMNLILMPIWFLSGAFFPPTGLPSWLGWLMRLNPLTYGMAALRSSLYISNPAAVGSLPPLASSLIITAAFAAGTFVFAANTAQRHLE
ncbi:MAG TPA: ABC transporter permease [Candidatus Binatia bacterium]|jgi:ABC-2 type transport system permease protein|nr:ABC transporter permease [Candidatus Binatia bacterium]